MLVRCLDLADEHAVRKWDDFVVKHGQLYHDSRWADVLRRIYGFQPVYLYQEEQGSVVSLLPLFRVSKPFGRSELVSIPHLEAGGMINTQSSSLYLNYLYENARADTIKILQFNEPLGELDANRNEVVMVKELLFDAEGIIPSLKSATTRNDMRQSLRKPYQVIIANDEEAYSSFYKLYLDKMRTFGTPPHAFSFFRTIRDTFANTSTIIALKDSAGEFVGATLIVGFSRTLYSMFFVVPAEHLKQKAGHLLEYQVMLHAVNHGYTSLSLGRCELGGPNHNYKTALGGKAIPLYGYKFVATADGYQCIEEKTAKQKYQKMAKIWSKLPPFCTDYLGPVLRKWVY